MDLFEIIEKLKENHDKEDFNKAIEKLRNLIASEIGEFPVPYDISFNSKDEIENKTLEQFVNSDSGFKDLIEWNINDLDSLEKVFDLVKDLKELQIRRPSYNFLNSKVEKVFDEELLACLGLNLEITDEIFLKYAELIPYVTLNSYIVMYDGENSYNLIKNYFDSFDRNDYFSFEYDISINWNDTILENLSEEKDIFQYQEIKHLLQYFIYDNETNDSYCLKSNGLLKHFFDNELFHFLEEGNKSIFIDALQRMKVKNFEPEKDEQYLFFFRQLKASIISKAKILEGELSKDDYDEDKVLNLIGNLSNQYLLDGIFYDGYLMLTLNDAFLKLEENRNRYS